MTPRKLSGAARMFPARSLVAIAVSLLAWWASGQAVASPFTSFNVYSLGDIGEPASPYSGDFQGISGAGGSCWLSDISINGSSSTASDFALMAGGGVAMTGTVINGSIEAAGNINLQSANIDGSISCGADVQATGGHCSGDVHVAGAAELISFTVDGEIDPDCPFTESCDHQEIAEFLIDRSDHFRSLPETDRYALQSGEVQFNASAPVSVFHVPGDVIAGAWGVRVNGAADQIVIINISGAECGLTHLTWVLSGTIDPSRILVNFPEAVSVQIAGTEIQGSILAPHSAVSFVSGLVHGGLWVADLQGSGKVEFGYFEEPTDPPTPVTGTTWGAVKAQFR